MQNNEIVHVFECPLCKISIALTLADSYNGVIKLHCFRCKKMMQKNKPPIEGIMPALPLTSNNLTNTPISPTNNLGMTADNIRVLNTSNQALPDDLLGLEEKEPEKVAHYTLLKRIGRGGMGEIYLAEDTDNDKQQVAIKLLSAEMQKNDTAVKRFLQEAKVHRLLGHPNIVKIHEVGYCVSAKRLYLAMEYVDGGSLENLLEQVKTLSPRDSIKIAIAICHALEHALERHIIHRDLKPANILIDRKSRKIKVGDLGLGKLLEGENNLTGDHVMMGTVYYMPPEQIENARQADHRADIYALGATLYHMLAGKPPYSEIKGNHAVVHTKIKRDPIPIQEYAKTVCPLLAKIVSKSLSRDIQQRYNTPTEMLQDLHRALQEQK